MSLHMAGSSTAPGAAGAPGESRSAFDEAKRGSAELLILALVEDDSLHGYEIGRQIELRSGGLLTFTLAALYATLYRMEARRWITGRWVEKAGQRRRRHYRITDAGRKVLAAQREDWARLIGVLGQVAGVKYA
jgi:PadR family transcriptional regulator PadR